jgi:hemoglobin
MRIRLILAAVAASAVMACGGGGKKEDTTSGGGGDTDMAKKTLFDRLGGLDAIKAVVDEFVANVAADDRIKSFFANTDIEKLKTLLVEQICAGTGGPCTYTGRDMKQAHLNMGVKEDHFNALVEDLVKALDKFNVPQAEKDELLGILGPMKDDIVQM